MIIGLRYTFMVYMVYYTHKVHWLVILTVGFFALWAHDEK